MTFHDYSAPSKIHIDNFTHLSSFDGTLELALGIIYFSLFFWMIGKMKFFRLDGLPSRSGQFAFTIKVLFGFGLTLIYTNYYPDRSTADIFKYFDDSEIMFEALFNKPLDFLQMITGIGNDNAYFDKHYYSKMNHWYRPFASNYYNDTHIVIRFNALMRLMSFGYFSIHTIFFNFIALIGLVAFYKAFEQFVTSTKVWFGCGLIFLPSVLFWGSGVLKEGLIFFALGFSALFAFKTAKQPKNVANWLVIFICTYLLLRLKFYVLLSLIPGLIIYILHDYIKPKNSLVFYTCSLILMLIIALNIHFIFPQLNLVDLISEKQEEFIRLAKYMKSGSLVDIPLIEREPLQLITAIPNGVFNSLCRPLPWESNSMMMVASALENLLVLFAITISIIYKKSKNEMDNSLILFSISFILILYALIGISTPVLGALVRYKVPALLFVILTIALLLDPNRLPVILKKQRHT